MEEDESVPKEQIEQFKKTALIQKSVNYVKMRAQQLAQIRGTLNRYL